MTEYHFDHDRLDDFRRSVEYLAEAFELVGIVAMLTKMAMKFDGVSEGPSDYNQSIDYEYENRDAQHEHEEEPKQSDADGGLERPFLTCVESTPRPRSRVPFAGNRPERKRQYGQKEHARRILLGISKSTEFLNENNIP